MGPLKISATRKRQEKQTAQTSSTTSSVESWIHVVMIENSSIKPLENLVVKYRVYMVDDSHGASRSEMKLKAVEGGEKFDKIDRGAKMRFETMPVTLEKTELKGGWYYTDGSKGAVKDKVRGIWVKVFQDGKLLQEFINPTTLSKSDPWTEE